MTASRAEKRPLLDRPVARSVLAAAPLRSLIGALVVALAAATPYLSSSTAYFIGDDFGLIWLLSDKPTFHVLTLFHRAWTESIYGIVPDELRPTLALSYQVDSLFGPGNPFGYHLGNILQHVLCSLLVFSIARHAAGLTVLAATFAATLFAVLPIHPEAVAWISGRADTLPALFYLASFLTFVRWRQTGQPWLLAASAAALFLALFTKQSAITMIATLVAYDLLVLRRRIEPRWSWLAPYLPCLALTAGYILLRKLLFGNAVREQDISAGLLLDFWQRQGSYIKTLLTGSSTVGASLPGVLTDLGQLLTWAAIVGSLLLAILHLARIQRGDAMAGRGIGSLLFFGPIWWLIQVLPLAVTYEAPRHLYLASVGACVALALLLAPLRHHPATAVRLVAVVSAALMLFGAIEIGQRAQADWNRAAALSLKIRNGLQREALAVLPGSLIAVGAPSFERRRGYHTWIWMWSAPFAYRPPFMAEDLTLRVNIIEPPDVNCCQREQWEAATRAALDRWGSQPSAPVVVLRWLPADGSLLRSSDRDDPALRAQIEQIRASRGWEELCQRLAELLQPDLEINCAP